MSVHELKTAMESLRVVNQRLTSHVENSPLGVVEFDADLNLTSWFARAGALLGWSDDSTSKPSPAAIFGADDTLQSELRVAFRRLQQSESTNSHASAHHVPQDGSTVHCEWFNSALTDAA